MDGPENFAQWIIALDDEARAAFVAGVYVGLAGADRGNMNAAQRGRAERERERLYAAANRIAGVPS